MSKYEPLWIWIKERGEDRFTLSFAEIESLAGVPMDHSFLTYKKELSAYGWKVGRISLKEKTAAFERAPGETEET